MIWVYVIWSQSAGRTYVGITADVSRRLKQHNAGQSYSTKDHIPYILVFSEPFADRTEARIREKYLKSSAGRGFIRRVIQAMGLIK
jgi:putative endonuclease